MPPHRLLSSMKKTQQVLWGGLAVLGATALGLVGGARVAVGGLSLVVFLCFVKYALVGDVVP